MSWKAEVIADNSGQWVGNGLTFATYSEACCYAFDLASRWTAVRDTRIVEVDVPVSHAFDGGRAVSIEKVTQ